MPQKEDQQRLKRHGKLATHVLDSEHVDAAVDELLSKVEVVLEGVLAVLLGVGDISGVALQRRANRQLKVGVFCSRNSKRTIAASTTPPAFFAASIPRRMFSM